MTRSDAERLDDMREQSARIGRLAARGREAFDNDEAIRFATERAMEIIGEDPHVSPRTARIVVFD